MPVQDNFADLETFLARFAGALSPRERKRLLTKVGQSLRRANSARIAQNVEPEGGAMKPRRPRPEGKRGKMFRRLRLARVLKVRATSDQVSVRFIGPAQKVAETHHFGLVDDVGRTRDGRTIRARYAERRLLGFSRDDEAAVMQAIEDHLAREA